MVLVIIAEAYTFIMMFIGLIGLAFGINRTIKKREDESRLLQGIAIFLGLVILLIPILLVYAIDEDGVYSNYTLLLLFIVGLSYLSRPLKKLKVTFTIVIVALMGLFWLTLQLRDRSDTAQDIPIEIFAIVIISIVLMILLASFIVERAMDTFLIGIGWGPLIVFLSLLTVIQAIFIQFITNHYGLLYYLGFGN
jgi:hypothetical protein